LRQIYAAIFCFEIASWPAPSIHHPPPNTHRHPQPIGAQRQTQIQPVAFIRLPEFCLNGSSIYILRSNAFYLDLLWQAEWNRGDEHLNFKLKIDFSQCSSSARIALLFIGWSIF